MRFWIAAALFAAFFAWRAASADPVLPPPTIPVVNHAGDDGKANQDLAKELEDFHAQAEQAMKQMDKVATQAGPLSAEKLASLQGKVLKLAQDDRFIQSAEDLWQNQNRKKVLVFQLCWFLFMLIVKEWRRSQTKNWFHRLLIGGACSLLSWIGIIYVIPLQVLGQPFAVFTGTLWRVFVMS